MSTTVREARAAFFARAGFDERSYDDAWVHLRFGRVPFAFPNTASRKKAVRVHDVHHALTGYDTTWRGELAISAWEIGSGCGRFVAAWVLDLGGLAAGAVVYPRTTLRAFVRGRRSGNLYRHHAREGWERMLDDDVDAVRARLPVANDGARPTAAEWAAYVAWASAGAALWFSPLVLVVLGLACMLTA